ERLPGVEVHASDPAGKLIVTIESDEEAGIAERLDAIRALDAVYTASLVYHHVEDVEDLDSEVLR
ncbi:MAG: chaperone NapD, partial [Alphaproteobacteria bacterium]